MADAELVESLVRLWRALHTVAAPTQDDDITGQQFWLLRQLRREGPMRVTDLAAALGIAQNTVTAASKRLEARELITRQRMPHDERVVQVALTEAGAARVDAWRAYRHEAYADLLSDLTPAEQAQLQMLLDRVLVRAGEAAR
ncbi:MAG: MarR family transcriptional regulator [Thermomicrobiales bacterium]|nr:MarR family transcriptional regulator [Thermomicrobiales bacterium]